MSFLALSVIPLPGLALGGTHPSCPQLSVRGCCQPFMKMLFQHMQPWCILAGGAHLGYNKVLFLVLPSQVLLSPALWD